MRWPARLAFGLALIALFAAAAIAGTDAASRLDKDFDALEDNIAKLYKLERKIEDDIQNNEFTAESFVLKDMVFICRLVADELHNAHEVYTMTRTLGTGKVFRRAKLLELEKKLPHMLADVDKRIKYTDLNLPLTTSEQAKQQVLAVREALTSTARLLASVQGLLKEETK